MKKNEALRCIDIMYPKSMEIASPEALAITEGFMTRLIKSKKSIIKFKVDTDRMVIECNDNTVKQYLDIILKTKKLNDFYHQLTALLHPNLNSSEEKGRLICRISDNTIYFIINEECSIPNFSWEVTCKVK